MKEVSQEKIGGIRCPKCGCAHFYTTHTERLASRIRRRKVCRHCGRRIVTVENECANRWETSENRN